MTPTWHTPLTWQVDQLVTEADLNGQLRDNLTFLKDPPTAFVRLDEEADYTTSSDEFVDVDRERLALKLTTAGGDLLVVYFGMLFNGFSGGGVALDVALDGRRVGRDDGLLIGGISDRSWTSVSFTALVRDLAAGSHQLYLQWKRTKQTGVAQMLAGAGTLNLDVHPQFWAREIS
ncbi:MAG: hypothetical protein J4G17_00580 [Anaerolineae bacterium]|nr:hypothetical protein [Anaerolineae bacterium]